MLRNSAINTRETARGCCVGTRDVFTMPCLPMQRTVEAAVSAATFKLETRFAARFFSQATRLPLQLRAIDQNDFSLVWPVARTFHKTSAHWILTNVIPFLTVTFVTAQNMIKESGLPKFGRLQRHR